MMEEINLSGAECDEFDFYDEKPSGERWAPVGASELDDEGTYEGQEDSWYVYSNQKINILLFHHLF